MEFLKERGCFADLTMPGFGTLAQPTKVDSIYYVNDTAARKSYDTGVETAVGIKQADRFLMFDGPIGLNFEELAFRYGAVESYALPSLYRTNSWIDGAVHVKGKPEWVFVKVHSHGVQSSKSILQGGTVQLMNYMETACKKRGWRLHYVPARVACNHVRAAEDKVHGAPKKYRSHVFPLPCKAVSNTTLPVKISAMSADRIHFKSDASLEGEFRSSNPGLLYIRGAQR